MPTGIYQRKKISLKDRLIARSMPVTECGCWFFLGALNNKGYGLINDGDGRCLLAHRVSLLIFCEPIPDGFFVLHSCDVTCCINPDHLRLGTQADNMADMARRGRSGTLGTKNPIAKLSIQDVREIRASTDVYSSLANRYGISIGNVSMIRSRHSWRHVQ